MPFDPEQFKQPVEIICNRCKHYRPLAPGATCDAFPNGIPDSILDGEEDHKEPIRGDNGIQFKPIK
jgi:hypothetical protein